MNAATMSDTFDAIILGAGGAGLMAAGVAGQRGRRTLVVDHADKPGKKILISGGGRCNFTNLDCLPERYISSNRHFAKSALRRFSSRDFIDLVNRHNIAWHEKTLGQLFCDGSARQIVQLLLDECPGDRVSFVFGQAIRQVEFRDSLYRVSVGAKTYRAPKLVIATGGPSIPKMGATGFAYDLARQFGLRIRSPRPALVPFTLDRSQSLLDGLAGIATPVSVRCGKTAFAEAALFTHRGLSGPAMLQISSYWRPGQSIFTNFLPEESAGWLADLKSQHPRKKVSAVLNERLPRRLAQALAMHAGLDTELGNTPDKPLRALEARLAQWEITPNGTEGYAKAEVTAGGIDTAELSSQTMQTTSMPGLYAIGEAVDVTGWLGGYNFQWAWSSGWAAGQDL